MQLFLFLHNYLSIPSPTQRTKTLSQVLHVWLCRNHVGFPKGSVLFNHCSSPCCRCVLHWCTASTEHWILVERIILIIIDSSSPLALCTFRLYMLVNNAKLCSELFCSCCMEDFHPPLIYMHYETIGSRARFNNFTKVGSQFSLPVSLFLTHTHHTYKIQWW